MRIIFESQLYPECLLHDFEVNAKGILDYAAHNLCKAILTGLKQNHQQVELVNFPNLGSFPVLYNRPWVKGIKNEDGVSIPFWNITYLKRYDIRRRLQREIKKQIQKSSCNEELCLLIYNFTCLPFIESLKKDYPNLKVFMIVTDIPEYMLTPESRLFKYVNNITNRKGKLNKVALNKIDGYVLLAPAMREKMQIEEIPWIQVEGIYNSDTTVDKVEKEPFKTILYTGNLGLRYGIGTLLEAFHSIPDNDYRLWICGGGDGLDEVKKYSEMDSRIIYKGILPRYEILRLQKRATVLINPRNSGDDYTRYSFPSKTMEYLASGTPVIMSHLQSIPKEYDVHIYYVNDESIDGFKNKIIEVCSKPKAELISFGEAATHFIFENKTPMPQMEKVIKFLKSL